MNDTDDPLRIIAWGTYDLGKPRVRILLRGLRENGVEVLECHRDVWQGVEDKSQVAGWRRKARFIGKWLIAYPSLIVRYLRLPKHDAVLVPYMGQLDVLILWPFAKLRRRPIIWDAFLSLYNTIVEDRQLVRPGSLAARLLFAWEWLACRAADVVLVDTNAHGRYFIERFGIPQAKVQRIFVGAEPEHFYPSREPKRPDRPRASFTSCSTASSSRCTASRPSSGRQSSVKATISPGTWLALAKRQSASVH